MVEKPVILNIPNVETWTMTDLKYTCKRNKVKGYTKMTKDELIVAVNGVIEKLKSERSDT